jgi:hypothetical protein
MPTLCSLTVPKIGPEDNRQNIIDHSGKRIALEDMPPAQDGVLQNDTLQNIDCLHLREPIDLSLDNDSPNKKMSIIQMSNLSFQIHFQWMI